MVDLTLDEIFETLSVLEKNPFILWSSIQKSYSKSHFDDVIKSFYGKLLNEENEKKLREYIDTLNQQN
jgi:hypothetical protein